MKTKPNIIHEFGPVAQLDRASDYELKSGNFNSLITNKMTIKQGKNREINSYLPPRIYPKIVEQYSRGKIKLSPVQQANILLEHPKWFISYSVVNPASQKTIPFKVYGGQHWQGGLNRIHDFQERLTQAMDMRDAIEQLLSQGITPFNTEVAPLLDKQTGISEWLDKFIHYKLAAKISRSSKNNYRCLSGKFKQFLNDQQLSHLRPDEFTAAHLNRYIDHIQLNDQYQNRTIRHYYGMVRTFFNWLLARDVIPTNPAYKIKERLREFKLNESDYYLPPTDAEIKKVVRHLNHKLPMLALFQRFIYYCSLRRKEVFSLRIADINLTEQRITMDASHTKNSQTKFPLMPDIFIQQFPKCLLLFPSDHFLFGHVHYGKKHISISPAERQTQDTGVMSKIWNRVIIKGLGISMRLYANKHLGISRAIEAGIPHQAMQRHADHQSSNITIKHYYKKRNSFDKDIKENYPPL